MHPELIDAGFLSFVEARRKDGEEPLFPDVRTNANGKVAAKLGEWFTGLVKDLGLKGTRLGMHSFRHSFEDRLREAELPERTALALARRSEKGSKRTYGDGLSVSLRARAMQKIIYPGLDLSHLHARPAGERSPARALARAQRWLRDATAAELNEFALSVGLHGLHHE